MIERAVGLWLSAPILCESEIALYIEDPPAREWAANAGPRHVRIHPICLMLSVPDWNSMQIEW